MPDTQQPPQPTIFPMLSRPGVRRDGTLLDSDYFTQAMWCRWQRARARKMGGYREVTNQLSGPPSELFVSGKNGFNTIHSGAPSNLERMQIDSLGNATGISDRTPAVGFVPDPNNLWQFDALYNAGNTTASIIAHAAPNAAAIDQETLANIFIGDLNSTAQLTLISGSNDVPQVSGGIVAAHPYMFYFGDNGYITWSGPNLPADCRTASGGGGVGGQRITSAKIVRGLVNRGGPTNAPSALFWSLDSLLRASFVGGAPVFKFDTVSDQSSIMSSNCAIEYDGLYYWMGIDRFLFYNGVIQELPNLMNVNFLFDNLNYAARQTVFVHKVPRYGEIWWCVPLFGATQPNWAIIYNIREQTWYDTPLPEEGRSAAFFSQIFQFPIMAGVTPNASGKYSLWQHEYGVDKVTLTGSPQVTAIDSWFETNAVTWSEGALQNGWSGIEANIVLSRMEPDFVVTGPLTVTIKGRPYAMAPDGTDDLEVLWPLTDPQGNAVYKIDLRDQRRQMRFKIESNSVGGNYEMGKVLLTLRLGDERPV